MSQLPTDLRSLTPARVCLIKPSSLGDIVHALPVLSALRTHWPDARISWVVNRGLMGLLDGNPLLDEIIPFDRAEMRFHPSGVVATGRFCRRLRAHRFDLAIDLQGLLRSGLMAVATGARVRVGRADAREGASFCYTHRVAAPASSPHAVDRLLSIVRALGAEAAHARFEVAMTPTDRAWAREILKTIRRPCIVLNMGARWVTKRWPPEHFAEIARRASKVMGAGIVVVGASEDGPSIRAFRSRLGDLPALDLGGRTTLPRLAALAAESDLFVSNDTGPLHLAAAAGARVLGIYTCTSPALTGPYGLKSAVVESRIWCAASCLKNCDRLDCMAELTPDRVWRAVRSSLRRTVQDDRDVSTLQFPTLANRK